MRRSSEEHFQKRRTECIYIKPIIMDHLPPSSCSALTCGVARSISANCRLANMTAGSKSLHVSSQCMQLQDDWLLLVAVLFKPQKVVLNDKVRVRRALGRLEEVILAARGGMFPLFTDFRRLGLARSALSKHLRPS